MKSILILSISILFVSSILVQAQRPSRAKINYGISKSSQTINYTSKKPGHYDVEDWRALIDSTWGEGLPTATKLQMFDNVWNTVNAKYVGFHNLDIDWDVLRAKYRPEVEAGVSHGRFAAIMHHMLNALSDVHAYIYNLTILSTPLAPGIPLLFYGYGDNMSHFGATLTPLPDSSLLVIKVLPNHPLGLIPGDIVLGYDGIPWKNLYKELVAAELPVWLGWLTPGTDIQISGHINLITAGMNWHLFDTLDVVKYSTNDTAHYPTSLLAGQTGFIWGNEQLPVAGVPWVYDGTENLMDITEFSDMISWGIVEGTNIGYIYAVSWWGWDDYAYLKVAEQFYNAVDSLMHVLNADGLIIDMRINYGGQFQYLDGFSSLFNHTFRPISFSQRCNSGDHYTMCPYTFYDPYLTVKGNPQTFHDRPLAVLIGPATVSCGDFSTLYLKLHPMARLFGKPTNGAFGGYPGEMELHEDWYWSYTNSNVYRIDEPGKYLTHKAFPPDEEVWLTQEDVAKGEDTVVKRAIEWIQNLAHAHDVSVNETYVIPNTDSIIVTAHIENPNHHELSLVAEINNLDDVFVDSLMLYDDGMHGDSVANDDVWGNFYIPTDEQSYKVSVTTNDISDETSRTLPNVVWFTTIGPIKYDSYTIPSGSDTIPNPGDYLAFRFMLHNRESQSTATNITAKIVPLDTCASLNTVIVVNYGDIASGETVLGNRNQYIRFSDKCTDGYQAQFAMEIYSNGYHFWSDTFEIDIISGIKDEENVIAKEFKLHQNYPNPFNPSTTIEFSLPKSEFVELKVFNILGKKVAIIVSKNLNQGNHTYTFDGKNLASGIYYYQLVAGDYREVKKMILLR